MFFRRSDLLLSLILVLLAAPVFAQDYIAIDIDRGIYCAEISGGDNMIVKYDPQAGIVAGVNPDAELDSIRERISGLKKRQRTLKGLRKRQLPSKNLKTYLTIYRYVYGKKPPKTIRKRKKAVRSLNKTLRAVRKEIAQLEAAAVDITACENGESLSNPSGGTMQVLSFKFKHPDYGVTYYMFGIAAVFKVNPKKSPGPVCMGAENVRPAGRVLPTLPTERYVVPQKNPCAIFWPTTFREYPYDCSGENVDGDPGTAVIWFDAYIGLREFGSGTTSKSYFQRRIDDMGFIRVRPYSKKNKCIEQ
jgi:hypothetical protein